MNQLIDDEAQCNDDDDNDEREEEDNNTVSTNEDNDNSSTISDWNIARIRDIELDQMKGRDEIGSESNSNCSTCSYDKERNHKKKKKKKAFRINAKKFFLTYPQCNLTKEELLEFLKLKGNVLNYVVCMEDHKEVDDENCVGVHLHAVVEYSRKLNIVSERAFDYKGFHPNTQACKSWEKASGYCMKDGNFIHGYKFDDTNPKNYIRREADFKAWVANQQDKCRKEIEWPIELPDGSEAEGKGKKRHYWIRGPPDWGKSTWFETRLNGYKVYKRGQGQNNYPFDDYKQETLIIYDDVIPKTQEWLSVCNNHWNNDKVYGDTRYGVRYYPNNTNITMIVLSNELPNYPNMEVFNARFTVIDLPERENDVPNENEEE